MSRLQDLMPAALLLLAGFVCAQEGGDLQAQILYAYQTEDDHRLGNLVQDLAAQVKASPSDSTSRYHLAHAEYLLGERLASAHKHQAKTFLNDCVDDLKPILAEDVKSVEALVLQSACYAALGHLEKIEGVLMRSRATDRLKAAYALAPRNPRVVFFLASDELARTKTGTPEHQRGFEELKLAAELFDQSSGTNIDTPGWGHAEAYLAMGLELKSRGDRAGARSWIEKSLLAAPDYKVAQRQLALLSRP